MGRHLVVRPGMIAFAKISHDTLAALKQLSLCAEFHRALIIGFPEARQFLFEHDLDEIQSLSGFDKRTFDNTKDVPLNWLLHRSDQMGENVCLAG